MKPPVHRAVLRPGPLDGVHGEWLHSARGFGKHWHDGYAFGVMDEGGHRSASGRGPVEAVAGQIVTSNPGEVHDGSPLGAMARRWRMVHVAPEAMASMIGTEPGEFTRPVLQDPRLRTAIVRVFDRWDAWLLDPTPVGRSACEEALTQVCGLLASHHSHRPLCETRSAAGLDRVRDCLLDRLDAPPRLDELAQLAGLSRFQLVRQFARANGLPPFAWLQQQRLRQAKAMIGTGTPLGEVAAACGFADQSHLNRHFLRSFGFTPGAWQSACGARLQ